MKNPKIVIVYHSIVHTQPFDLQLTLVGLLRINHWRLRNDSLDNKRYLFGVCCNNNSTVGHCYVALLRAFVCRFYSCCSLGVKLLEHGQVGDHDVVALVERGYCVLHFTCQYLPAFHAGRTHSSSTLWLYSYCVTASADWEVMFIHNGLPLINWTIRVPFVIDNSGWYEIVIRNKPRLI